MQRKTAHEVRMSWREENHRQKGCQGKRKYMDESSALSRSVWDKENFSKREYKGREDAHRPYKCDFCGFWHIGTMTNPFFRKDYPEWVDKANALYWKLPYLHRGGAPYNLEALYAEGLLRKEELQHGEYYLGWSKHAKVVRWHAVDQLFFYFRIIDGEECEEGIPHPADGENGLVYVPVTTTRPTQRQRVYAAFGEAA